MTEHEHDESCEEETYNAPIWRFSLWDVVGVTMYGVCGVLSAAGTSFGIMARHCEAAANQSRQDRELWEAHRLNKAAREEMAQSLERIVGPIT